MSWAAVDCLIPGVAGLAAAAGGPLTHGRVTVGRRVLGTVTMPVSWAELGGPGVAGRCHANHVLPLSLTAVTSHGGAGLLPRDPAVVPVLPAPAHG